MRATSSYSPLLFLTALLIVAITAILPPPPLDNNYDYQLVRTTVNTTTLQWLHDNQYDVWSTRRSSTPYDTPHFDIDLLVCFPSPCPVPSPPFLSATVLDPSVTTTILTSQQSLQQRIYYNSTSTVDEFFDAFRDYDEFLEFFGKFEKQYEAFVKRFVVGTTVEGNQIVGFKVTAPSTLVKYGIHIQAMQHAREWLAPTTLLFCVVNMLELYDTDPDAKLLLDSIEYSVVPIVNVDGYIYTWTTNRLWRKNRRLNSDGTYGVDLNRNWGPASTWCTSGSSTIPSSDVYCGTSPFSEPETRSLYTYLDLAIGNIQAGIDFHTYGPLLLWPWQYTYDRLPDGEYEIYLELGKTIEVAINGVHGQRYVSEQGSDLYPHSGGFIDYNWSENGFFAFTLEGRGNSFVVPVSDIVPAGEEAYAGLVVLSKRILLP